MADRNPLVSVIIPTFNRAKLLGEAVGSVTAQTYRPIEIIVIDDGSTDGTGSLCGKLKSQFVDEDITLKYIQKSNSGASSARNTGFKSSSGDYIQYLDSDDLLHPEKLSAHISILESNPSIKYVFSDLKHFVDTCSWDEIENLDSAEPVDASTLYFSFKVLTCVGLYRRELCVAAGPWREDLPIAEDLEYSFRALTNCSRVFYLPGELTACREHSDPRMTDALKRNDSLETRLRSLRILRLSSSQHSAEIRRKSDLNLSILYFRLLLDASFSKRQDCMRKALNDCMKLSLSWDRRVKLVFLHLAILVPPQIRNPILQAYIRRSAPQRP